MTPRRLPLILAVAAAALAAAWPAGAATPRLNGEVGPGFKIEVTTAADKDVKTLKAGTYVIRVQDKSTIHDFHLVGPGVNKTTTVAFKGTKTWTIKLEPGTYTYKCDPHAAMGMKGKFKVTG